MTDPVDGYLWDRSEASDPEIAKLERQLAAFRYERQPLAWDRLVVDSRPKRSRWMFRWAAVSVVTVLVALATVKVKSRFEWRPGEPWQVVTVAGAPQIGGSVGDHNGRLPVGQTLQTDAVSRARLQVASLGVIEVEPDTRLRLIATGERRHRISLDYGTISAHMWAPPFSLSIDTRSATLFDLGCAFTLNMEPSGYGRVYVTSGWVQFETPERQVNVPAGAEVIARPGLGPGTPYFSDSSPEFRSAVTRFDSHPDDTSVRARAVEVILASARRRDAFTLLNLLRQVPDEQRGRVLDRLAGFVPIPAGFTRDEVSALHQDALDAYWNELHLSNPKNWMMKWRDVMTY